MAIENLFIIKSINGIATYGTPPSDGKGFLLTPNVNSSVAVPTGATSAFLTYSAGATVQVLLGISGDVNALPTSNTGTATRAQFNKSNLPVQAFDLNGHQQYINLISPNDADFVIVTFYKGTV